MLVSGARPVDIAITGHPPRNTALVAMVITACAVLGAGAIILPAIVSSTAVTQTPETVTSEARPAAKKMRVPVVTESEKLSSLLQQFAAGQPVSFGIYVRNLKTGAKASNLGSQQFTAASLYKLFVAVGILRSAEAGQLSLSNLAPGTKMTIEDCLEIMITVSSNTCGHALGNLLGWEAYDGELKRLGFRSTSLGGIPKTTANDVGTFFNKLSKGSLFGASSTTLLTGYLKDQRIINRLPQGLPPGTEIAHKTGDLYGYMHDAGIVYGAEADYIVVALSGPWPNSYESYPAFAKLSSKLYGLFN